MKATIHYATEFGTETVATIYGVHTPSEVYDRCQTGKARSADVPRDMQAGDVMELGIHTVEVTESGFEKVS